MMAGQRADSGTKNSCSSRSLSATAREAPSATASSISSSEAVGEPLEEEDGEDVVLVVGRVDLPAQDVRGLPQLRLELLSSKRHPPLPLACIYWPTRAISRITASRSVSRRSRAASTAEPYAASEASTSRATMSSSRGVGTGTWTSLKAPGRERRDGRAHRQPFGELCPPMGRTEKVPQPVAHTRLRLLRPRHQQRHARHRPRYVRRHERHLDGSGARGHQHVEGPQQVALGADALDDADLPQAAQV